MEIFMDEFSKEYKKYRIIIAMYQASWHTGDKCKQWENIVSLLIPPRAPELNPVENFWHHIRTNEKFNNHYFNSMDEVEDALEKVLAKMHKETEVVKSLSLFNWISSAL